MRQLETELVLVTSKGHNCFSLDWRYWGHFFHRWFDMLYKIAAGTNDLFVTGNVKKTFPLKK